jgi:hypothetical protein
VQRARLVTLLFTDIESSTRLLESVGDAYSAVLERYRAILSVLRLSREFGSSSGMRWALEMAMWVLWRPRPHDAALLCGAVEAALHGLHGWTAGFRARVALLEGQLARADLADRRVAGRSLSLERAVDLALQIVEEERTGAAER